VSRHVLIATAWMVVAIAIPASVGVLLHPGRDGYVFGGAVFLMAWIDNYVKRYLRKRQAFRLAALIASFSSSERPAMQNWKDME